MNPDTLVEWQPLSVDLAAMAQWIWSDSNRHYTVLSDPWRLEGPNHEAVRLEGALHIDRVFIVGQDIILVDWRKRQVWRFTPQTGQLSLCEWAGELYASAMAKNPRGETVLLNRFMSRLVFLDSSDRITRTLGTRLGVSSEERLGFEWPEDACFSPDFQKVLVADSGNDRLLRIDTATGGFLSLELPVSPMYILHDGPEGWLVSDGADALVWGNDKQGPLICERDHPLVCCRIIRVNGSVFSADESGNWGRLAVKMPQLQNHRLFPAARLIVQLADSTVQKPQELLSELDLNGLLSIVKYSAKGAALVAGLSSGQLKPFATDPESLWPELLDHSLSLYLLGKEGKVSHESEQNRIQRAINGYRLKKCLSGMITELRQWLKLCTRLTELTGSADHPATDILQQITQNARDAVDSIRDNLDGRTEVPDDRELISMLLRYVIARKVLNALNQDLRVKPVLVLNRSLVKTLEQFDLLVADLHYQYGDLQRFKELYEWELEAHPNQTNLEEKFLHMLFKVADLDAIEQRLNKSTNQRKQHLNAQLSLLYEKRGDTRKAAQFLRRELDLFPNRLDLLVRLVELDSLDDGELDARLSRALLGRSGQIDTDYHLGRIHLQRGKIREAFLAFLKEAEGNPGNYGILYQIKELLYTQPTFRAELTAEDFVRIWDILRNYISSLKSGSTQAEGLTPLLFVLNHISGDIIDQHWLKKTMEQLQVPEWRAEVRAYLDLHAESQPMGQSYKDNLPAMKYMLEHLSCRENLASALLSDPETKREQLDELALVFPEALPMEKRVGRLHIDYSSETCLISNTEYLTAPRFFDAHTVLYMNSKSRHLTMTPLSEPDRMVTLWEFSGENPPFWVSHRKKQIILIWDEAHRLLREINAKGEIQHELPCAQRPWNILGHGDGFHMFRKRDGQTEWALWQAGKGFLEEYVPMQNGLDHFSGYGYQGETAYCSDTEGTFYRYRKGVFTPLFRYENPRFMLHFCGYLQEMDLFFAIEACKGVPFRYLSLFNLEGRRQQRLLLTRRNINWLFFRDLRKIMVNGSDQWLLFDCRFGDTQSDPKD